MEESVVNRLDPWKEDGNIVLTAQGKSHFRVHRSVLSANSGVFKRTSDYPLPETVHKETVDLCPVTYLEDPVEDVQIMLKAMYDRSYPAPCHEKMPISVVAAFLRMGRKYAMPPLVSEGKAKLRPAFEPASDFSAEFMPSFSPIFPGITEGDPRNFQIINLLQEMNLTAALPLAMYHCIVTCPLKEIVDGYRVNGSFYSLSPENLRSFIRMKDILENHRIRLAKFLRTSPNCTQAACADHIHPLWSEDMTVVPPLCIWKSGWDDQFCDHCTASLKLKRAAIINKTWNQLPTAFGFYSWKEVKKTSDFPSCMICAY